jgi:hypothetical protein
MAAEIGVRGGFGVRPKWRRWSMTRTWRLPAGHRPGIWGAGLDARSDAVGPAVTLSDQARLRMAAETAVAGPADEFDRGVES